MKPAIRMPAVTPRVTWSIALLGLLMTGTAGADPGLADLGRYIEQTRSQLENVGVAVAVVKDDKVVFAQGFGVREQGKAARIGPDTLFQIGSTTKAFTTAALGILVDEGKIRWDDPVIDYLPGFQLQDPWLTRHLTIRDTVTHRSGITDSPYFAYAVMDADTALDQLRYIPSQYAFRDSYHYSNLMYVVAGKIVAAASGMSWNEFVEQRLLQPLRMKRSGTTAYEFWNARYIAPTFWGSAAASRYSHADARDANVAMPHFVDVQSTPHVIAWQSYDNAAAAGTIVSSADEMANWLILHLNQGAFAGRQLLQADTVEELHAVQNLHCVCGFPFADSTEPVQGYAMGWVRTRYHDQALLAHGGGILGFPAYVAMIPGQRMGVVVLANSSKVDAGDRYALHKAIALRAFDQLLDTASRDWNLEFLARAKQAEADARSRQEERQRSRLLNAPPSLPLEHYAGDYEDRLLHSGRVKVRVADGQLTLSFDGQGAFSGFLDPWHHDVFRLRLKVPVDPDQFPGFVIDPAGKVASMSFLDRTFDRLPAEVAQ